MEYTKHYTDIQKKSAGTNTMEYIVLHHTGAVGEGNIKYGYGGGGTDVSFHYLVMQDGRVYKYGEDSDILWHCGRSFWEGKSSLNQYAIGIETEGPGFTDKQRSVVVMLLKELCQKHNIKKKNLLRHKDISPGRKFDIDDSFWSPHYSSWDDFKDSLFTLTKEEMQKKENEIRLLAEGLIGGAKAIYRLADDIDNGAVMNLAGEIASKSRDLLEEMGFDTSDTY